MDRKEKKEQWWTDKQWWMDRKEKTDRKEKNISEG